MSSHPDFLPTGAPVVGLRRSYGVVPPAERLGVGVIGLHEGKTLLVALRSSGLCRPVAGCDLSKDKREAALECAPSLFVTADYDELLARPDVDIVAIYTPDHLHAEHIERAFRAGKHVLCTKPLINDPGQAARIRGVAAETGKRLQVGQSTRFGEAFLRQRALVEQGAMGDVEVVDAHYNHRMDWLYEKSPWSLNETHWAYLGLSHPVDLICWYLGPIREVHAYGMRTALAKKSGLATPDAITVNLLAENGRIGRVLGNYGFHELGKARSLIECLVMGSEGTSLARYPDLRLSYTRRDGAEVDEDFESTMAGY
jgi:predicted dehydrogenase